MSPFEFLDHRADIGLRVRAGSLEELFEDAAIGMFRIISNESPSGWPESRIIELESADDISLLVDWLGELIYLLEVKKFWPEKVKIEISDNTRLKATVDGIKMEGTITGTEIKAITYHMLEINHTSNGCETDIYFDL